jgi:hypothetical protein
MSQLGISQGLPPVVGVNAGRGLVERVRRGRNLLRCSARSARPGWLGLAVGEIATAAAALAALRVARLDALGSGRQSAAVIRGLTP